jgi:hypothetical protein
LSQLNERQSISGKIESVKELKTRILEVRRKFLEEEYILSQPYASEAIQQKRIEKLLQLWFPDEVIPSSDCRDTVKVGSQGNIDLFF